MRTLALLIALLVATAPVAPLPARADDAQFMLCEALPHRTCVQDGDLIWLRGQAVRLSDIRTAPRYSSDCKAASLLGWKAALRLRDLLNEGPFDLVEETSRDGGYVDEILRLAERDGQSLGQILLREGLAKPWSKEEPDWCAGD
jgi:endonuclease YncB( thermonuclease family)